MRILIHIYTHACTHTSWLTLPLRCKVTGSMSASLWLSCLCIDFSHTSLSASFIAVGRRERERECKREGVPLLKERGRERERERESERVWEERKNGNKSGFSFEFFDPFPFLSQIPFRYHTSKPIAPARPLILPSSQPFSLSLSLSLTHTHTLSLSAYLSI